MSGLFALGKAGFGMLLASIISPVGSSTKPKADPGAVDDEGAVAATCIERLGKGQKRPGISEKFPKKGVSGHLLLLELEVLHQSGETVLPGGFGMSDEDAQKQLEGAGFFIPEKSALAAPTVTRAEDGSSTDVAIPLVALPKEPGRQELTLPPLPISVARANGKLSTVCTAPHAVLIEDPIANEPDPKPRENPNARPQREHWQLLEQVTFGVLAALLFGLLFAWLFSRWRKRPRALPPPPPPRPPWEVALEELDEVRRADLIRARRLSEHFDRASDAIRRYLGGRYGFDGLESTTREALTLLENVGLSPEQFHELRSFLRQADLVKFANLTPSEQECDDVLTRGEGIVRSTMLREEPALEQQKGES
jgi:hypothetical protein